MKKLFFIVLLLITFSSCNREQYRLDVKSIRTGKVFRLYIAKSDLKIYPKGSTGIAELNEYNEWEISNLDISVTDDFADSLKLMRFKVIKVLQSDCPACEFIEMK